ncbi:MAG TPA: DUF2335 domain-containing protein [Beijerinckiaceae bacterium]|nr:DUF2335 domain-containing protein [Beijerinckiaceae bacterium]
MDEPPEKPQLPSEDDPPHSNEGDKSASAPPGSIPNPQIAQISPQLAALFGAALTANPAMRPSPALQRTLQIAAQQSWRAPFPPPEAVERYEKVLPGTFDRLIAMAEKLQAAQISQGNAIIENTRCDNSRGHSLGFSAMALALAGALFAIWLEAPAWVDALFLSMPVLGVAKSLIESVGGWAQKTQPSDAGQQNGSQEQGGGPSQTA